MTSAMRMAWALAIVLGTFAASVACPAPTEKVVESGRGFVTTVYTDTEVESCPRTTQHLRGVITSRYDSLSYVVWLGDSGLVRSVDLIAVGKGRRNPSVHARHMPMPPGTLPMMHGSGALLEQVLRRARALGGDSISVPIVFLGANPTTDVYTVSGNGPDSLIVKAQSAGGDRNALHVAIDSMWHVTGMKLPISGEVMQPAE